MWHAAVLSLCSTTGVSLLFFPPNSNLAKHFIKYKSNHSVPGIYADCFPGKFNNPNIPLCSTLSHPSKWLIHTFLSLQIPSPPQPSSFLLDDFPPYFIETTESNTRELSKQSNTKSTSLPTYITYSQLSLLWLWMYCPCSLIRPKPPLVHWISPCSWPHPPTIHRYKLVFSFCFYSYSETGHTLSYKQEPLLLGKWGRSIFPYSPSSKFN